MNLQQFNREEGVAHRVVDTGDGVEHVVDLGPDAPEAAVDVVGDTAMVVLDDEQYDIALPGDDPGVFMRNGVLTITMEDSE